MGVGHRRELRGGGGAGENFFVCSFSKTFQCFLIFLKAHISIILEINIECWFLKFEILLSKNIYSHKILLSISAVITQMLVTYSITFSIRQGKTNKNPNNFRILSYKNISPASTPCQHRQDLWWWPPESTCSHSHFWIILWITKNGFFFFKIPFFNLMDQCLVQVKVQSL